MHTIHSYTLADSLQRGPYFCTKGIHIKKDTVVMSPIKVLKKWISKYIKRNHRMNLLRPSITQGSSNRDSTQGKDHCTCISCKVI